jgi:DNA-directed RNA polymerase specialized sigma24 family protein
MVMTVIDERSVDAYAAHGDELIRFATGLVGPSDAQDVAADAMARLMSSRVWMEVENPRALMYRAVLYEARTFVRSRRRRLSREARAAVREAYEMPDLAPEVSAAVAGLTPRQRAVVFLTYWDDLDPRSVAALFGGDRGDRSETAESCLRPSA